jgi:hypothetical protein
VYARYAFDRNLEFVASSSTYLGVLKKIEDNVRRHEKSHPHFYHHDDEMMEFIYLSLTFTVRSSQKQKPIT